MRSSRVPVGLSYTGLDFSDAFLLDQEENHMKWTDSPL